MIFLLLAHLSTDFDSFVDLRFWLNFYARSWFLPILYKKLEYKLISCFQSCYSKEEMPAYIPEIAQVFSSEVMKKKGGSGGAKKSTFKLLS